MLFIVTFLASCQTGGAEPTRIGVRSCTPCPPRRRTATGNNMHVVCFLQAIYRKVTQLGLSQAYLSDPGTRLLCRRLMALPVLPHEHIQPLFDRLHGGLDADTPQSIQELFDYTDSQWVRGRLFTPRDFSVFGLDVRTNNDVEGYHNRLNRRGQRGQLQFYLLCHLLHEEARLVTLTTEFVRREDVVRCERHTSKTTTERLQKLWAEYTNGDRTPKALLDAASNLICPAHVPQ